MITPDSIVEITDLLFVEQVVQSKLPVLLAFGADRCPASQKLLALLAEAAPRCCRFITIAKTSPDTSPELVARFGILSVPAILLFRGGTVDYQFIGELSRHELDELLARVCIGRRATVEPTRRHAAASCRQNHDYQGMISPVEPFPETPVKNIVMNHANEINLGRLDTLAREHGLVINPDPARVQKVVGLMTENYLAVGEYVCPCKQRNKPVQQGREKTCPCPEWLDEIARDGHCFCKLFFKP